MNVKEKINEVLKQHDLMCVCTVDKNGMPKARSVDFAIGDDESTLYFMTNKATDKVKEIQNNNNVYIVIDHACDTMEELSKLRYIKASGKAYVASSQEEAQKLFGALMQRFPYLKDLPGDPSDFYAYRVELDKIILTDNTVHFGYSEELSY